VLGHVALPDFVSFVMRCFLEGVDQTAISVDAFRRRD
jgi:hypothetical protein